VAQQESCSTCANSCLQCAAGSPKGFEARDLKEAKALLDVLEREVE
jgi:hypothetical protein